MLTGKEVIRTNPFRKVDAFDIFHREKPLLRLVMEIIEVDEIAVGKFTQPLVVLEPQDAVRAFRAE